MAKNYPELYERLKSLTGRLGADMPATMGGFASLHKNSIADGALTAKTKELAALGIAVAVRCDGCIAFHVHDALAAGATKEEVVEIIGVAMLMGGGPALMYGAEAYEAVEQFTAAS
jgi:AhpD family alkylhydroperoxidase